MTMAVLIVQSLRCMQCEHEWREKIIGNVPVNVWTAHVKSLRCPNCGAVWNRLAFREAQEPEGTLP